MVIDTLYVCFYAIMLHQVLSTLDYQTPLEALSGITPNYFVLYGGPLYIMLQRINLL